MKEPTLPRHEMTEDGLHQYLLDRPELLLKMLDVAETRQERKSSTASRSRPASASTHWNARTRVRPEHGRRKVLALKS